MTEKIAALPVGEDARVQISPDMAEAILAFLDRSTMIGSEVQAFLRVQAALKAIALKDK